MACYVVCGGDLSGGCRGKQKCSQDIADIANSFGTPVFKWPMRTEWHWRDVCKSKQTHGWVVVVADVSMGSHERKPCDVGGQHASTHPLFIGRLFKL